MERSKLSLVLCTMAIWIAIGMTIHAFIKADTLWMVVFGFEVVLGHAVLNRHLIPKYDAMKESRAEAPE